jgi:hypothetical protein
MTDVTVVTVDEAGFDYAALDMETRIVVKQRTEEIRSLMRQTALSIIEIGIGLEDVKRLLGYGQYVKWLDQEFQWSVPTAYRFTQVASRFQNYQIDNFAPSALYLLAAPSTPDEAVAEALERAESGEQITHAAAKEIVAAHRLEMYEIEQVARRVAQERKATASDLRTIAWQRIGKVWQLCLQELPANMPYRELSQALNNIASQMEQAALGPAVTTTIAPAASDVALRWRPSIAPLPVGWDDEDEAEYAAVVETWKLPGLEIGLDAHKRLQRPRVVERLIEERRDNVRFTLQDWLRILRQREAQAERLVAVAMAPDPWVAAWQAAGPDGSLAGSRLKFSLLARAMMAWALAWRDDKGRTWRDVAVRNPQHANSPFRMDAAAECRRRGLEIPGDYLATAISHLFVLLQQEHPATAAASDNSLLSDAAAADSTSSAAEGFGAGGQASGQAKFTRTPTREQVRDAFAAWLAETEPALKELHELRWRGTAAALWRPMLASMMDRCQTVVGINSDWLDEEIAAALAALAAAMPLTESDAGDLPPVAPAAASGASTPAESEPVSQREGYDSDEWYTPGWVVDAARRVLGGIDLDPASCAMAQEVVQAGVFWSKQQDGCRVEWAGRVWLNPPYSAPGPFVEKLIDEYTHGRVSQACVLLNNATETKWFQRLLARFPVCFFNQRMEFWRHDHSGVGARQGQALFYLGPGVGLFCEVFGEFGIVVRRVD